jgi:hypothetical protein
MAEAGMLCVETGEPIGEHELADIHNQYETARSTSKRATAILRVSLLWGLGPTGTTATFQEEQQCSLETVYKGAETMWIWIFMVLLFMLWIGFPFATLWFWRKLHVRLGHTELQQAEADTYMWTNRESIDAGRAGYQQLEQRFNAYVEQTDGEVNMLEEYINCVRDGLVNIGGFVRLTSLTRQQRESMFTQERANGVLSRMSQREPDVTDPPVSNLTSSSSGLAGPSSSSAAVAPAATTAAALMASGDGMMLENGNENGEESESPTTDDADIENADPSNREGHLTRLIHHLRNQLNEALANELWEDANEIQVTIQAVLD